MEVQSFLNYMTESYNMDHSTDKLKLRVMAHNYNMDHSTDKPQTP